MEAMSQPMVHHRTETYSTIFAELNENLKVVFQTQNPVLTFAASGTGGMEAAISNFFSPGDRVLALCIGRFGERFAKIAQAFSLDVEQVNYPLGEAVDVEELKSKLAADPGIKGVLVTHNETSTGVANDLRAIGEVLRSRPALLLVDAVSSLGGMELRMDEWGLDVVVTGSQKALMCPPGLTFMGVSEKAWKQAADARCPRFYFDALKTKKALEKDPPQNPYTPAISLIRGANEALKMIREEGIEEVFARHRKNARAVREGVKALGFKLFASEKNISDTITPVVMPEGLDGQRVKKVMDEKYDVVIAGGQDELKGKIIRIGHMGYVGEAEILQTLAAFENALIALGISVEAGRALAVAQKVFRDR
jgi:aspartate aminotransferase-like enzyme